MTNSTNDAQDWPPFTVSAYFHRTMTTIPCTSASRSAAVVVLQQATESLTAFDAASDGIRFIDRLDQFIAESLMVPFCVVMLDLFANGVLNSCRFHGCC
jgi:hypothetical protein